MSIYRFNWLRILLLRLSLILLFALFAYYYHSEKSRYILIEESKLQYGMERQASDFNLMNKRLSLEYYELNKFDDRLYAGAVNIKYDMYYDKKSLTVCLVATFLFALFIALIKIDRYV
ncbi:hypothetical protein [uncultured Pedobacter sp.]|uniref:hypothetical protein n=1 Tax=uncultured Pedobacter sp. TaxID=246139 RepID=UPI0026151451|nr:hypothetical protein [uncultured Pedobacter sp.]